jgi:hypothetical protein
VTRKIGQRSRGSNFGQRGEDHPVGRRVAGPGHLSAQYQQLMAEYGDLYVLGIRRRAQTDQTEDLPDEHQRQGAHDHGLILPGRQRAWSQPEP